MTMRTIELRAIKTGTIEENLRELGYSSRVCVKLRKRMGLIICNNQPVPIVYKVQVRDNFTINLEDSATSSIEKYDFPINIAYEDQDLAIIDKPSGLAVINTRSHYGKSLENVLANHWGEFTYRPVNRLDKDTSGLMIVAKNQVSHSQLAKEHIRRKYIALCEGKLEGEGIINKPIGLEKNSIMKRCVTLEGKDAITRYKVIANYSTYSAVELELETGRTHQIRVHMASIGHPLLADFLYNPNEGPVKLDDGFILNRQALHSYYIEFSHPITGEKIIKISQPEFIKIDILQ